MANTLHIISGVTAVGKTNFALDYAEEQDAEIISCDASLIYRGMDIGTAKPTALELKRIPHHLINVNPVDQPLISLAMIRWLARRLRVFWIGGNLWL